MKIMRRVNGGGQQSLSMVLLALVGIIGRVDVAVGQYSRAGIVDTRQWVKHSYDGEDIYRDTCMHALQAGGAKAIYYPLQDSNDGWNLWLGGNVVLGMYMLGTPSPVDGHRTDDLVKACSSHGITKQIPVLFNSPDDFAGHFDLHDNYLHWFANSIAWAPNDQFIICLGLQVDLNQQISTSWTPAYVNQMAGKVKQYTGNRFPVAIHARYPQCLTWGQGSNIDIIYLEPQNLRDVNGTAQIVKTIGIQTGKQVEVLSTGSSANNAWATGVKNQGGGWKTLPWFGTYSELGNHWIWHAEHGYLQVHPDSIPSDIWFYDAQLGWLWTNSTLYPNLYRLATGVWMWYRTGTSNPRWFKLPSGWESH